jgi:hypothetical protein
MMIYKAPPPYKIVCIGVRDQKRHKKKNQAYDYLLKVHFNNIISSSPSSYVTFSQMFLSEFDINFSTLVGKAQTIKIFMDRTRFELVTLM